MYFPLLKCFKYENFGALPYLGNSHNLDPKSNVFSALLSVDGLCENKWFFASGFFLKNVVLSAFLATGTERVLCYMYLEKK
jgi:hypothetical protein